VPRVNGMHPVEVDPLGHFQRAGDLEPWEPRQIPVKVTPRMIVSFVVIAFYRCTRTSDTLHSYIPVDKLMHGDALNYCLRCW